MNQKMWFKKKLLASAVASCAVSSGAALAQQGPALEEVVVTGMRASLERAMDIKRDSSGVVDAISAEDIGKFPDTNLAESLQRITGVSISRENGEGSKVTVRGFGEDYNMVTLNGRTMPAADAPAGSAAAGRGFDFAQLASEVVSGIEVYKTGKANIASGGIGATINIKTARPLDNPGLNAAVGVKAVHDTTNRTGDDITPEISGIFSWTDDSEMFGVGVSLSRQERDSGATGSYVSGWNTRSWADPATNPEAAMAIRPNPETGAPNVDNAPDVGQLYNTPNDIRYYVSDRQRTRTNAQLVLQFSPSDRLTGTVDYTYAENELTEQRSELSLWYNQDADYVMFDEDQAVATPVIYSEFIDEEAGKDTSLAQQLRDQTNELKSFGLNIDFAVTDSLTLTLDAHDSTADSLPTADWGGSWVTVGMGARVIGSQATDYRSDLPVMTVGHIADCGPGMNCNGEYDIEDIGSQVQQLEYSLQTTDITQVRLDGLWELENGSIQFGVEDRSVESRAAHSTNQNAMGDWGLVNPGDIPNEYLYPQDFAGQFDDYSTHSDRLGDAFNTAWAGDAEAIGRWGAEEYGFEFAPNDVLTTDRTITEDIQAAYFQFGLEGELGGMATNLLVGMRYEDTEVTSVAQMAIPEQIIWQSNNDFLRDFSDDIQPVEETASYDHLLPNLDFSLNIRDDLVGRLSFSQTIARPTYDNLSAAINVDQPSRPATPGFIHATASQGNPGLVPLESNNFDLSLEWYFDDASYASIGYFEKRVDNFVGTEPIEQSHFGLRDVTAGPRAQAAREALEAREDHDGVVSETELFTMVVAMQEDLDYDTLDPDQAEQYDVLPDENDPLYQFSTDTPVNNESARIYGFELAVQHFFAETGFGVQANYTSVNGDVGFDNTGDPSVTQFALVGLSDTANLALMYEDYGVSARLAYNWRDRFLASANNGGNNPRWVEAYGQLDLNVSYDINDNFQVFFEGINLTEENSRSYARSPRQLWDLEDLGARYQVGARYAF